VYFLFVNTRGESDIYTVIHLPIRLVLIWLIHTSRLSGPACVHPLSPYELAPGMGKGSWAEGGYSENDGLTDQRDAAVALGRLPAAAANYKKTKQPFFIGLGLCVALPFAA
jgi:hypothetical protein